LSSLYILYDSLPVDVGLVKIFPNLWILFFSYRKCPSPYKSFSILWVPICQFLIIEHNPLVFCSGYFPLCHCVWGFAPLSPLLDSVYLVLYEGLWSTWTWALWLFLRVLNKSHWNMFEKINKWILWTMGLDAERLQLPKMLICRMHNN
jgi:hypothetical protein